MGWGIDVHVFRSAIWVYVPLGVYPEEITGGMVRQASQVIVLVFGVY